MPPARPVVNYVPQLRERDATGLPGGDLRSELQRTVEENMMPPTCPVESHVVPSPKSIT
jgi:hypothetical protein